MDTQYNVFISYKSEEIEFTKKIAEYLQTNNINVWYAPKNLDQSASGLPYDDAIADIIKKVQTVVVLVSERSLNSQWVRMEIQRAEKTRKRIIPFVISEYSTDNGLVMRLETLHMIQAYTDIDAHLPILLENVSKHSEPKGDSDRIEEFVLDFSPTKRNPHGIDYAFEEGMALFDANEKIASIEFFLRSAQRGNKRAKELLCEIFYEQNRNFDDIDEALWGTIESISDHGEAFADFLMHCKYYAMAQNIVALKYLQKSLASEPIPLALLRMGISYSWGLGVKQNHILGVHYYNKAIKYGCKQAYSYLAQEYIYGSDKVEKSGNTAERLLLEGVKNGDSRCYSLLSTLYNEQPEKCYELAQRMINENISGGYIIMAEYYAWKADDENKDQEKALEMAHEALNRNEKGAYGLLATLYYNEDEDEAIKYARIGTDQSKDSQAIFVLAYHYENEKDYETAWELYKSRYEKFGTGADDLGRLFLDCEYTPKEFNIGDLKQALMVGARNYNLSSLKLLLRLMTFEVYGECRSISFDNLINIPRAYEFVQLGVHMNDEELKFILGRIMIETNGRYYNPRKGLEIIEEVIDQSSKLREDAVVYMIKQSYKTANKWLEFAVNQKIDLFYNYDTNNNPLLLQAISRCKEVAPSIWKDYLEWSSRELGFSEKQLIALFSLTNKVLEQTDFNTLTSSLKKIIRDVISGNIDNPKLLHIISTHFDAIIPDFKKEEIAKCRKKNVDEKLWTLFMVACGSTNQVYPTSEYLKCIYEPMTTDAELMDKLTHSEAFELTATQDLKNAMDCFSESYHNYCKEKHHNPEISPIELKFTSTTPYIAPELLEQILENRVECLLEILPTIDEDIQKDIVDNISNHEGILNIAERLTFSTNLQLLLICYVENFIYIEDIVNNHAQIIETYKENKSESSQVIEQILDDYRKRIIEYANDNKHSI